VSDPAATLKEENLSFAMFEKTFVVEYADADKMGVLHNNRYCRLLEDTFTAWMRSIGQSIASLEQMSMCVPVRTKSLKFISPIFLEKEIRVIMKASWSSGSPLIQLNYNFVVDGQVVTKAAVTHVLCKYRKERPSGLAPIPADWLFRSTI